MADCVTQVTDTIESYDDAGLLEFVEVYNGQEVLIKKSYYIAGVLSKVEDYRENLIIKRIEYLSTGNIETFFISFETSISQIHNYDVSENILEKLVYGYDDPVLLNGSTYTVEHFDPNDELTRIDFYDGGTLLEYAVLVYELNKVIRRNYFDPSDVFIRYTTFRYADTTIVEREEFTVDNELLRRTLYNGEGSLLTITAFVNEGRGSHEVYDENEILISKITYAYNTAENFQVVSILDPVITIRTEFRDLTGSSTDGVFDLISKYELYQNDDNGVTFRIDLFDANDTLTGFVYREYLNGLISRQLKTDENDRPVELTNFTNGIITETIAYSYYEDGVLQSLIRKTFPADKLVEEIFFNQNELVIERIL